MKNIFLLVIFITNISLAISQIEKKVLFLGNSYIYVNDLPNLISKLASANNDTLIKDQNTPGGYTLQSHSTNTTSLSKISSQDWDYVVIQGQSQQPSFPPAQVESDVYPYAKTLNDSVVANNPCTETLFFMTWGRQNGDQDNCPYYTPLCTYEGMQERLRESYLEMGVDNYASVAPVGVAWKKAREITNDTINLYSSDESHPSIYGSYLAACVFYASIFNKSPVGNTFISSLPQSTANLLQNIANNVVFDSSYVWNFQTANFGTQEITNLTLFFLGTENTDTDFWDFGDGTTSTAHNTTHTFPGVGVYQVKHIISNNCLSDTTIIDVSVGTTDITNLHKEISVYPNPACDFLIIDNVNFVNNKIFIIDIAGKIVKSFYPTNLYNNIDISDLQKGMYFLKTKNFQQKFIKN